MPEPSARHRTFVETDANGNPWAKCSCGWAQRHHFPLAARREAKAHRRYPEGNPRLNRGDDEPDEALAALPEYDEPYKSCPNGCGRSMPPWRYGPCQLCCWEAAGAR